MTRITNLNFKERMAVSLLIAILIGWFVTQLVFIKNFSNPVIIADVHRHIASIILPFVGGEAGPGILWSNHHASPILHLHQMVVLYLFDGNQKIDAYVGLFLQVLIAILLCVVCFRNQIESNSHTKLAALLISGIVLTVSIGFVGSRPYSWPLVSLQAYFQLAGVVLALCTWWVLDAIDKDKKYLKFAGIYVGVGFISLLMHATFGFIFVLASAWVLLCQGVIYRSRKILLVALAGLAVAILYRFFILDLIYSAKVSGPEIALKKHIFSNPLSFYNAFGKAVFNGLHGEQWDDSVPFFVFFLYSSLYILTMIYASFSRNRLVVAGVIMVAIAAFALSSGLFRGAENFPHGIAAPRYVLSYKLGATAMIWVLLSFAFNRLKSRPAVLTLLLVAVMIPQFIAAQKSFAIGPLFERNNDRTELSLYMMGTDPVNRFRVGSPVSVKYLVDNKVNIFDENFPSSQVVEDYKRAKSLIVNSALIVDEEIKDKCHVIDLAGEKDRVWVLEAESKIRTSFALIRPGIPQERYYVEPGEQALYGTINSQVYKLCFRRFERINARIKIFEPESD